jgi:hypothetical protein
MQCSNYFTNFYTRNGDSLVLLEKNSILPNIQYSDFFIDNSIKEIAEKYLPKIQEEYFPEATIYNVYEEIYHFHFILPRYGTDMTVELTVCDYIPTNAVNIDLEDWALIESKFKSITLKYDKSKKVFVRK